MFYNIVFKVLFTNIEIVLLCKCLFLVTIFTQLYIVLNGKCYSNQISFMSSFSDFGKNECNPETINVEPETNEQNDPTPEDSTQQAGNPSETQVQEQTALRKMVLEVIFGSGSSNVNQDLEATHNMLTMGVNGEHHNSEGSASSPEPYDTVESVSCDSASLLTSSSSAVSPVLTSDDGGSVVMEETSSVRMRIGGVNKTNSEIV